ncbi:hypothetical protein [Mycolicibacterium holsaticum]|uniref:Uncharacterized protein n=1 Tax=Mycolicibacterium holsaticum TaxID=152142 RepID=A0A1E3RKK4_9MYCO|nr:hypothetical protein [Mycolicibacterium holsaticum]ODQ89952.1 hypothetical protein BHQ17_17675 [Mycolicibacterium holsaticum]
MSMIPEHEYARMTEYARQKLEERRAAGDRSVPGFPEAVADPVLHEVTDWTDEQLQTGIRFLRDQDEAAEAEAQRADNTADYGIGWHNDRFEAVLRKAMDALHAKPYMYVETDKGGSRPYGGWNRAAQDPRHPNGTGIHGIVAGRITHTSESFVFLVNSGAVRRWIDECDLANTSCAVGLCDQNAARFPRLIELGQPRHVILHERAGWLYAVVCCSPCLGYLQYQDMSVTG